MDATTCDKLQKTGQSTYRGGRHSPALRMHPQHGGSRLRCALGARLPLAQSAAPATGQSYRAQKTISLEDGQVQLVIEMADAMTNPSPPPQGESCLD